MKVPELIERLQVLEKEHPGADVLCSPSAWWFRPDAQWVEDIRGRRWDDGPDQDGAIVL